ncbi:TPA: hypothetical protein ACH2Z2_000743 [Streptococcus pyogenes]|uniref:hypothetical protein n=1 Tax=Streptococcus pyogenes TaxID=1314 RepID=UPI00031A3C58|nr:hypothetical protein [Streptococcus pyogenes]RXS66063.1 hypothetical protein ER615_05920 [Streptococcus pyogenes]
MTLLSHSLKILSYFSQFTPTLALENVSKMFFMNWLTCLFSLAILRKQGFGVYFAFNFSHVTLTS